MAPAPRNRVAIYARFSSERQSETSINDQVRRCQEYVANTGGVVDDTAVFTDFAISGSSLSRPGFEALMAAVEAGKVDAIVTEDISRISRDFADAANVFKRLQYAGVPLIGIADGIDTGRRDAKLSFTLKSLVADVYLDDLRDKTLRGLEGKANAGYATGNTPYGYRTVPDLDASGRARGNRIEIAADQAGVVQRIFEMYRNGKSLCAIARKLNTEDVPSPRAGTRHKRSGWGASTIRAMLYNERYAGVWKFKETEWRKVPGTNKRRPRARDESEVMRFERPDLRIIEELRWNEVQARLQMTKRKYTKGRNRRPKGRARPPRKSPYVLSGLLYCGECDAPMTIVGGSSAAYYRCSDERKKGTCKNKLSVREEVARSGILGHLHAMLTDRETIGQVHRQLAKLLQERTRNSSAELAERQARLAEIEPRIHSLIEFIADGDRSEYVVSTLRDLEAQARTEKTAIARLQNRPRSPIPLPEVPQVARTAIAIDRQIREGDPDHGREQLRRIFLDGQVRLIPSDGAYVARSRVRPVEIFSEALPKREQRDFMNEIALFDGCSGDTLGRLGHRIVKQVDFLV